MEIQQGYVKAMVQASREVNLAAAAAGLFNGLLVLPMQAARAAQVRSSWHTPT
jgi:hypothetical protein